MQNGLIDLAVQLKAISDAKLTRQIFSEYFARTYEAYRKAENAVRVCPNDESILREFFQAQQEFFAVRKYYNNQMTEE
jgi:hypothetical protein